MKTLTLEQRREQRSREHTAQGLKIYCYGRAVPAMLVDVSQGGLGLEMFVPLPAGSEVAFTGELQKEDFCFALSGTARVTHCQSRPDGLYRVGLIFQDVTYRTLSGSLSCD